MSRTSRIQSLINVFIGSRKASRRRSAMSFNQPTELLECRQLLSATMGPEAPEEAPITAADVFSFNEKTGVLKVRGSDGNDEIRIDPVTA